MLKNELDTLRLSFWTAKQNKRKVEYVTNLFLVHRLAHTKNRSPFSHTKHAKSRG